MPVTVKEMQINTTVSGDASTSKKEPKAAGGGGKGLSKLEKEVIIKEAVRRALEEMEYRMGR